MKGYYKVPGRQVYCQTLQLWFASVILSYVVYKLNPPALPDIAGQAQRKGEE